MRGKFITFEGGEGAGKSTQAGLLAARLTAQGIDVVLTREPGGSAGAEIIRHVILSGAAKPLGPDVEAVLFAAARADHLDHVIRPALERGSWVVCDRFTDASFAYQGGGRAIDEGFIHSLEAQVQKGRQPDLTLLFDAPVDIGMARAKRRGSDDRMEAETVAFFERVREAYLRRAVSFPQRIKTIDAARPLDEVQAAVAAQLQKLVAP